MKRIHSLALLCLFFAACSTAPTKTAPFEGVREDALPELNYVELQNRLGIQMGPEQTGFREKAFDACDLGRALGRLKTPLADCHHAYFVLVQFQLSCRQEEQPSATLTDSDLTPLRNKSLKWQIGKIAGDTQTDFQGQAVIRAISGAPSRKNYLRVSTGVDFLNMRVEQATAIVTPPSWCGF